MARTLILGAGFGGLAIVDELRKRVPASHEIVLIDQSPDFVIGATKTWVMLDMARPDDVLNKRSAVAKRGVKLVQAKITKIDVEKKSVETDDGVYTGDHLVIALGADLNMNAVPGLAGAAEEFYSVPGAIRLRDVLKKFEGGRLMLLIPRAPFKCPAGPYEGALLLADHFNDHPRSRRTQVSLYTLEGAPMATAGQEVSATVKGLVEKAGIAYHPNHRAVEVDGAAKKVKFENESEAEYDLLIAVPPHEAPAVVKEAGLLGPNGWIPVDPKTCALPEHEGVFAVGDVCSISLPGRYKPDAPLVMPKAGVFAEAQARVVAANIAHSLGHGAAAEYDGVGYCFLETGDMHAMMAGGDFYAMPQPEIPPRVPDMMQYEQKKAWVTETIKRLLG